MTRLPEPYWSNGVATLHHCDARRVPLVTGSVHCIVTSPPYFGLRQYKGDGEGGIGLEASIDAYLDSIMQVMAECWRVLRDDGQMWVNLGDSYSGGGRGPGGSAKQKSNPGAIGLGPAGGESGQLLGIPARFHLRMMEAGWIVRDQVVWAKDSPMPESLAGTRWEQHRVKVGNLRKKTTPYATSGVNGSGDAGPGLAYNPWAEWSPCPGCAECTPHDGLVLRRGSWRCTSSYEVIFQCVKGMGYFSDGEAVKTIQHEASIERRAYGWNGNRDRDFPGSEQTMDMQKMIPADGRANRRDVWRDIHQEPVSDMTCPECARTFKRKVYQRFPKLEGHPICPRCEEPLVAHYASFPPDLPRICIQASTSEAGVCPECGAQRARVVEATHEWQAVRDRAGQNWYASRDTDGYSATKPSGRGLVPHEQTLGWRPTCDCGHECSVPALVFDPFVGTGTTCVAAQRLGRRSVGTDLSKEYLAMAAGRLAKEPLPLVTQHERLEAP